MGFIRHSFKRRLFFIILSVTLVLVIFGGILTIQGFQARIRADHEREDYEQEVAIVDKVDEILKLSESVLDKISENDALKKALMPGPKNDLDTYSALYEVTADIRDYAVVDLYLGGNSKFSTRRGVVSEELPTNYAVLREADKAEGATVYAMDPYDATEDGATMIIARKITDVGAKGYAVIRITQTELRRILAGSFNARDGFMLADKYFRPFCLMGTAESKNNLSVIRRNLFKNDLYNKDIEENVYISEVGDSSLISIYITPPAFEKSAVHAGYQIVLMQVVISVLLCLLVASYLSTSFAKPINTLSVAMKQFRKGDFDTKIDLNREDEFGQLASGFNKMTARLKDTMRERVEAERKVNEARIELMQAQLNPHFLYNTLDTIKWVAKANQVPEVATLSSSLATILRTGISENQFCMLESELDLVRNYCDIQKIRFDDCFDLEVDVADSIAKAYVPKLILQPLVENSIIHGLEGRSDGRIKITADRIFDAKENGESTLVITVTDNGKGISDEMIKLIETDDPEALKGHLGLKNVNTIIRLYYGREYGVSAKRTDTGTEMTVRLPFSTETPVKEREITP
ncbi:MAG: sensor histidine kinase [Lachnospiraceae bacterium]|nr:sensor histidine kinase [Lachnospiraceae bacterium]